MSTPAAARRNLERKVRVTPARLAAIRAVLEADGAAIVTETQVDRYFDVPAGRLKLRAITEHTGVSRAELIGYRRPDLEGSRWSDYRIAPVTPEQVEPLVAAIAQAAPLLVEVRKRREIAIVGATRVHLDAVEGLGAFVELETVIGAQDDADAEREHRAVLARLGIDGLPAEPASYSDLLPAATESMGQGEDR